MITGQNMTRQSWTKSLERWKHPTFSIQNINIHHQN
jgi:hypothetical protein